MAAPMRKVVSSLFPQFQCYCKVLQHMKIVDRSLRRYLSIQVNTARPSDTPTKHVKSASGKAEKISKAMKAFLERAEQQETFMKSQIADFEIGKRHLANIMGTDPDSITQEEIDTAVEYLMPAGLFDKRARPMLKHPDEIFPTKKKAQFDIAGRPFHALFYTCKPNFFQILHDAAIKYDKLKEKELHDRPRGTYTDPQEKLEVSGSVWISAKDLQKRLDESVTEQDHKRFVSVMERLCSHPYAFTHSDFIMQWRRDLTMQSAFQQAAKPLQDPSGRFYQEAEGKRKASHAHARVWDKGSGQVTINGGQSLLYFETHTCREQILFPLVFTGKLGEVDIELELEGFGLEAQAGAARLAISRALCSFVDKPMTEKMRLAGLLSQDVRRRERQKPGQRGARAKEIWKAR